MLIVGKYFQPFELIEHIEPLERFLDTQRHEVFCSTKMLINGKRFQPHKPHKRLKPLKHVASDNQKT
jgi:hypothetical protein